MYFVLALHNLSESAHERLVASPVLFTESDRIAFDTARDVEKFGFKFTVRGAKVSIYWLQPNELYRIEHFASTDLSHLEKPGNPLVYEIRWEDGVRKPSWYNAEFMRKFGWPVLP